MAHFGVRKPCGIARSLLEIGIDENISVVFKEIDSRFHTARTRKVVGVRPAYHNIYIAVAADCLAGGAYVARIGTDYDIHFLSFIALFGKERIELRSKAVYNRAVQTRGCGLVVPGNRNIVPRNFTEHGIKGYAQLFARVVLDVVIADKPLIRRNLNVRRALFFPVFVSRPAVEHQALRRFGNRYNRIVEGVDGVAAPIFAVYHKNDLNVFFKAAHHCTTRKSRQTHNYRQQCRHKCFSHIFLLESFLFDILFQ